MVWVRDLGGKKDPKDDVIRFYYISSCVYVFNCYIYQPLDYRYRGIIDPKEQQKLRDVAEKTLGPRNLRTPIKPKLCKSGVYQGGTAFERSPRAKHGIKKARCYTNAHTHQVAPNISSVTSGSKRNGDPDDLDDNLDLRREINLVCYPEYHVVIIC